MPAQAVVSLQAHTPVFMLRECFFYGVIFIPILIRFVVMFIFRSKLSVDLKEKEGARETYRPYIYTYLAISTAVLLALTIANAKGEIHLNDAVFCAVISFIGFELSLSMQTYKFDRFAEQLIDGILDNARLALYLTVIAVINSVFGLTSFSIVLIVLLALSYIFDYYFKFKNNYSMLRG